MLTLLRPTPTSRVSLAAAEHHIVDELEMTESRSDEMGWNCSSCSCSCEKENRVCLFRPFSVSAFSSLRESFFKELACLSFQNDSVSRFLSLRELSCCAERPMTVPYDLQLPMR